MDEAFATLYLIRGIERIAIQIGAILCMLMGGYLTAKEVSGVASTLTIEKASFKLQLKSTWPGIFIALIGAGVAIWGIRNPLKLEAPLAGYLSGETKSGVISLLYAKEVSEDIDGLLGRVARMNRIGELNSAKCETILEKFRQEANGYLRKDVTSLTGERYALLKQLATADTADSVGPTCQDDLSSLQAQASRIY